MSEMLTTAEILGMAIQIEANGAAFYRAAAAKNTDPACIEFLGGMAAMEDEHKKTFEELRDKVLSEQDSQGASPHPEGALYMAAIADGIELEGSPSLNDEIKGGESTEAILWLAVDMEKQSVLFYLGLRDIAPAGAQDSVDTIIAEEKSHIATLMSEIKKLA